MMQHDHAMRHLAISITGGVLLASFLCSFRNVRDADKPTRTGRITYFKYAYSRYISLRLVVGGTITTVLEASWSAAT